MRAKVFEKMQKKSAFIPICSENLRIAWFLMLGN
tara:strand:- start:253 stop:354 length:102 start_codon:yes stop_codon:yes gene_type:complete